MVDDRAAPGPEAIRRRCRTPRRIRLARLHQRARHRGRARSIRSGRRPSRVTHCPRVAVVGDASARRLESHGVAAHVVPDGVGAAALAAAIVQCAGGVDGVRVLWPRGDRAPSAFREDLEKAGVLVTSPIAYRTLPPADATVAALRATLESNQTAAIAFCSPSSAQNLARSLGLVDLATVRGRVQVVASIGPTTSAALSALGLEPDVQAESPSMASSRPTRSPRDLE